MKHIVQILAIIGIIFLILTLFMYMFQRSLIYHPLQDTPALSNYNIKNMRIVTLHTKDGIDLNSWYKPAQENKPTLLYLHGNAGNIGGRMSLARKFIDSGLGVLLLEYRGYGGNKGKPTEQGLYEDGRAGMRFLSQQGINSQEIVIYGESLGSGVATKLAIENKICALILQSAYTSLAEVGRYHYPWMFLKPWDRFDSIQRIQDIHAPILILHSLKDEVVPYSHGLALFNKAGGIKKMLSFENEGHNNIWNAPDFTKKIIEYINLYCPS